MRARAEIAGKLAKFSVATALFVCAAGSAAMAGSVSQPGETLGVGAGAPLPQGVYFVDTFDWGVRTSNTAVGVNIPVAVWSTPWTIFGGRFELAFAWPELEAGVFTPPGAYYQASMYNPIPIGFLAWNLGGGWNFSYALGAYIQSDFPLAWDTTDINQRAAITYNANGWDLTANVLTGINLTQHSSLALISPCPGKFATTGCNPDFVNLDLTATHTFGKWEIGPVAFGAWDVSSPIPSYARQSEFAIGGLVGYNFGPVIMQAYVTSTVAQTNYGYNDTRGWFRMIIPLWSPPAPPPIPTKG